MLSTMTVVRVFRGIARAVPDPSIPPSTAPTVDPTPSGGGLVRSVIDVVAAMADHLGANGYQTGVALLAGTVAVIAMLDAKVHRAMVPPVTVGAFWAGWLGWNTVSGNDQPLFPGDVRATKIWDVAFAGDQGFLIVAIVGCIAAFFLWRRGTSLAGRLWLLLGAVLGASFLYHLVEAIRTV
jgi:hypothetical protein